MKTSNKQLIKLSNGSKIYILAPRSCGKSFTPDRINSSSAWLTADSIAPVLRLPALSVSPEWAWLILNAGKDIENRTRRTNHRGPFLIHASQGSSRHYYNNARSLAADCTDLTIPPFEDLPKGGIVGIAEIVDCVTAQTNTSKWFLGPYGYVLANVHPLPFYKCPGKLGFFYLNSQPK